MSPLTKALALGLGLLVSSLSWPLYLYWAIEPVSYLPPRDPFASADTVMVRVYARTLDADEPVTDEDLVAVAVDPRLVLPWMHVFPMDEWNRAPFEGRLLKGPVFVNQFVALDDFQ